MRQPSDLSGMSQRLRVTLRMNITKLDHAAKEDIRQNYSTKSAALFAERYGVCVDRIYAVASQLGVSSNRRWEDDREQMTEEYLAGASLETLGAKYGHYKGNVLKRLKKWGVPIRDACEARIHYTCDRQFFKTIDTPAKAYWLGFIYADGNVYDKDNGASVFQIALAEVDRTHVESLRTSLKAEHPLYSDRGCARLMISSQELTDDLKRQGVTPRKSLTVTYPLEKQVPLSLQSHFIRGYFDGDGTITGAMCPGTDWSCQIIGTEPFLEGIRERLVEAGLRRTNLTQEKRSGGGKIFTLCYGGYVPHGVTSSTVALQLHTYLYRDADNLQLSRKRLKFDALLRALRQR